MKQSFGLYAASFKSYKQETSKRAQPQYPIFTL